MATFTKAVGASSDDGQQSAGTVTITDLVANCNNTGQHGAFRFLDVTIPQGSTINTATLNLHFPSTSFDSPDVTIYCEDTDNAGTIVASSNNISSRSFTSGTSWVANNIGGGVRTSPDFAADVQTVINRSGWASGNALMVIIKGNSASSEFRVSTWDSTNPEAEINIDYTPPAGGGVAVKAMFYARLRG